MLQPLNSRKQTFSLTAGKTVADKIAFKIRVQPLYQQVMHNAVAKRRSKNFARNGLCDDKAGGHTRLPDARAQILVQAHKPFFVVNLKFKRTVRPALCAATGDVRCKQLFKRKCQRCGRCSGQCKLRTHAFCVPALRHAVICLPMLSMWRTAVCSRALHPARW